MAYTKCSQCGESFHLRLTNQQALTELRKKESKGEVYCLACFKDLRPSDKEQLIKNTGKKS